MTGLRAAIATPILLLLMQACTGNGARLPISQSELADVMVDVYLAQAEAELNGSDLTEATVRILSERGLDTTLYNESIRLLAEDPELGKEIYQQVLDKVIMEQREIRAKMMQDSTAGDS